MKLVKQFEGTMRLSLQKYAVAIHSWTPYEIVMILLGVVGWIFFEISHIFELFFKKAVNNFNLR